MSVKFYICNHCKNIITKMNDSGVPVVCCGEKMTELIPGTSDGAHEKHVPAFEVNGNKVSVKVGSVEHPMMEKHYIQWILIETNFGTHCRSLTPEDKPEAEFFLADGEKLDLQFMSTAIFMDSGKRKHNSRTARSYSLIKTTEAAPAVLKNARFKKQQLIFDLLLLFFIHLNFFSH